MIERLERLRQERGVDRAVQHPCDVRHQRFAQPVIARRNLAPHITDDRVGIRKHISGREQEDRGRDGQLDHRPLMAAGILVP